MSVNQIIGAKLEHRQVLSMARPMTPTTRKVTYNDAHDMYHYEEGEDGYYGGEDDYNAEQQDGYYNNEWYDGDLEGYGGDDMFFAGEPSHIDPEQFDINDSDVEDGDEPTPLLNWEALEYETDSDSDDEDEETEEPRKDSVDLSPLTLAQAAKISDKEGRFIFKTLFDTGATGNMMKKAAIPKGAKLIPLDQEEGIQTTNGMMKLSHYVVLDKLVFLEFTPNRYISGVKCLVYDDPRTISNLVKSK